MRLDLQRELETLYGLERRRDKLGLDGTRALMDALGNPHERFRSVLVAGTNGKGSVCARVERSMREAGHRTGLYTSPHLVDFRERIRVDGRWADEAWLAERLAALQRLPAGRDRTFFEVATALGFAYFAERGVAWAVVEVGLGGRLDCTNVLSPEVCAITTIGLDHTEILGTALEAIAAEKAGIIKPGVPVVVGAVEEPAWRVIAARAASVGAPLIRALPDGPGRDGFAGDNAAVAAAVLTALADKGVRLPEAARGFDQGGAPGLDQARWPGRLERCPGRPNLWWDGAHNAAGLAALTRSWAGTGVARPVAIVLAVSRDKDIAAMLAELARLAPGAALVATRSRSERALDPAELAAAAGAAGFRASSAPDVPTACRIALAGAPADLPVLLTGSLFAVGEAMEAFGGAPGEWQ